MPDREPGADDGDAHSACQHVEGLLWVRMDDKQGLALGQSHLPALTVQPHFSLRGGVELQGAAVGQLNVEALAPLGVRATVGEEIEAFVAEIVAQARPGDAILVMSNGSFEGIHERLLTALAAREGGS